MRTRTLAVVVAVIAMGATPTSAAMPQPQIVDKAGDANGVNGQGFAPGAPTDVATAPGSAAGLDIVSVTFQTTGKTTTKVVRKKRVKVFTPDGFTVTMALSGAPTIGVYRVTGAAGGCGTFWFQRFADPDGTDTYSLRHNCNATGGVLDFEDLPVSGKVAGNSIVWTVKLKQLPKPVKLGTSVTGLGAETRATLVAVTFPRIDEAKSDKTYRIGG